MAPHAESHHMRGWVRSFDFEPAPGHPEQLIVEIRLADMGGHEQYARWRSEHYAAGALVDTLEIHHGDEVELHVDTDAKGGYTPASYIENHTRNLRFTLAAERKSGCFASMALLALAPVGVTAGVALVVARL